MGSASLNSLRRSTLSAGVECNRNKTLPTAITKGRAKLLVGSLDGKTSKPSTDISRADSQASHPGSFHRGAPEGGACPAHPRPGAPTGKSVEGSQAEQAGQRGLFHLLSTCGPDDRGRSAAPAKHTQGPCRARAMSDLQLHLPEQTQPRTIYSLLRYQQGQQPAHKATNEGGAVENLLEHFGIFTLFMFLREHALRLCHHIQ